MKLPDEEWRMFSDCPPEEYLACLVYESARENRRFINFVRRFRSENPGRECNLRIMRLSNYDPKDWHGSLTELVNVGQFPKRPWLRLSNQTRNRLRHLVEYNHAQYEMFELVDLFPMLYPQCPDGERYESWLQRNEFRARFDGDAVTYAAFKIDWRKYSNDELLKKFQSWVLANRSSDHRPNTGKSGVKDRLKWIGAKRINDHCAKSREDRSSYRVQGASVFSSDKGWNNAARKYREAFSEEI